MKYFTMLFFFVFSIGFIQAQNNTPSAQKIKFATTEHDFGNQAQGKPVTYEFEFTNTGKDPLILENVKASCGCTTPTWTKEPVMPGKKGVVSAQYNMAREGNFTKTITVTTKDGETVTLFIKGNAIPMKQGVEESEGTMIGGGKGE